MSREPHVSVRCQRAGIIVARLGLHEGPNAGDRCEVHRRGMGRMKNIDVAHLWLQDEVRSNRLTVRRVKKAMT